MRIGYEGASLQLDIAGYQFPGTVACSATGGGGDWDANWLLIAGTVNTMDGRNWSFQDPALTTWEVEGLIGWLQDVAAGRVPPMAKNEEAHGSGMDPHHHPGWFSFTEPNLSFAVGALDAPSVQLMVALRHEAAESPVAPQDPNCSHICVTTSRAELEGAAASLATQLAAYPPR